MLTNDLKEIDQTMKDYLGHIKTLADSFVAI